MTPATTIEDVPIEEDSKEAEQKMEQEVEKDTFRQQDSLTDFREFRSRTWGCIEDDI